MPTSPRARAALPRKPIIVGESNPYGSDPNFALYPAPDGCSGHRLCCLILGMRRDDYLREFDRVNLCEGDWSLAEARRRALDLLRAGGEFVLLGRKVADAFGVADREPFLVVDEVLLLLPHPSGRSRVWNDPEAVARTRAALAEYQPHLAHLIGCEKETK